MFDYQRVIPILVGWDPWEAEICEWPAFSKNLLTILKHLIISLTCGLKFQLTQHPAGSFTSKHLVEQRGLELWLSLHAFCWYHRKSTPGAGNTGHPKRSSMHLHLPQWALHSRRCSPHRWPPSVKFSVTQSQYQEWINESTSWKMNQWTNKWMNKSIDQGMNPIHEWVQHDVNQHQSMTKWIAEEELSNCWNVNRPRRNTWDSAKCPMRHLALKVPREWTAGHTLPMSTPPASSSILW